MSQVFDFDRSVGQAWRRFALRLAAVLSMMDETEPLTLQPCDTAEGQWCVSFRQDSPGHLTATIPLVGCPDADADAIAGAGSLSDSSAEPASSSEDASPSKPTTRSEQSVSGAQQNVVPTSHVSKPPRGSLTLPQESALVALGWSRVSKGFCAGASQDDSARLAQDAVAALRQVFLVEHPVFLDSNVLAEVLQEPGMIEEPDRSLDLDQTQVYPDMDEVQLSAAVAEELATVCGTTVMQDQDGDLAVRVGSTMLFVRVPSDGKEIRLFAVLVHDISGRSRAAEVLNDVNAHSRWVRFYAVRDKIMVTLSIFAAPYVPAHLRQAITEMRNIADGVDDLLAASLQGKTTFPD